MDELLSRLKENNLKNTPNRRAVLGLFMQKGESLSPHDVRGILKKRLPAIGLPTVYRILEELEKIGILTRVQSGDRQLHYSICSIPENRHHHHFICKKCKKVKEVEYCNFKDVSRFIRDKLKCVAESHSMQIEGLCEKCK
ncbi:MAG: Fur family transcriptional regulator [Candidatus Omnitrophota bacterium]